MERCLYSREYAQRSGDKVSTKRRLGFLTVLCLIANAALAAEGEPFRVVRFDVPLPIRQVAAEASSTQPPDKEKGEDFFTKNAIDGNLNTRWSSAFGEPQWLVVDLGEIYNVDKVIISWESAYAASYKIELSEDKIIWKEAYSTENGKGRVETITFPITKARYIKIGCAKKSGEWGFSIWEVSVYGKRKLVLF